MFNKNIAVLDFGSQNLTMLVGKVVKGELDIAGSAEVEYAGFINGEFLELEQLGTSLKQVIMNGNLFKDMFGKNIMEKYLQIIQ